MKRMNVKIRLVIGLVILGLGLSLTQSNRFFKIAPKMAEAQQRPNIVVIMVDDLDEGSLNVAIKNGWMPNLVKYIVNKGTRFINSFVSYSLCCPSRATFLSGQYPHNHEVCNNTIPIGSCAKFDDTSSIATWLQKAGYRTGHIGKYLNGYGYSAELGRIVHPCFKPRYVPPGYDDWQGLIDPSTYCVYNYKINDNGTIVSYGSTSSDYQTDVLVKRAVDFVNESSLIGKPFFLVVTPLAPHVEVCLSLLQCCRDNFGITPTIRPAPRHQGKAKDIPLPQPPSFNEEDFSDKPSFMQSFPSITSENKKCYEKVYRDRIESLLAVDDLIGKIIQALIAKGQLDRTALIFTSDNGYLHGEHRWHTKVVAYEESIHVPLFIRLPNSTETKVSELFVLNNDLAPTIAELASATPDRKVDGRSLVSASDPTKNWRKRFLVEFWVEKKINLQNTILSPQDININDWEAQPSSVDKDSLTVKEEPAFLAVRTSPSDTILPNLTYVEYYNEEKEFYDLSKDPYQLSSLHNDQSELRRSQRLFLSEWIELLSTCGEDSCQFYESKSLPR